MAPRGLVVWLSLLAAVMLPVVPAHGDAHLVARLGLGPVVYERPVQGSVVAPFERPASAFGSGHRGVDLRVTPGDAVVAAADGVVSFAGAVAGRRWVTLEHADGIRTTYGVLADLVVHPNQLVRRGELIGHAAGATHADLAVPLLHWGARRGDEYLDPLLLVDRGPWRPALVGPGGWDATHGPHVPRYEDWDGRHRFGWAPGSRRATHAGWVHPPNPNHVVGVAGLGSHAGSRPIDLEHLGYGSEDITYLSYAGRRDGLRGEDDPRRDQLPYAPEDTYEGVWNGALALREQLRAQWERSPGQAVDLVGHSMGGVVIMTYLLFLHDPADPTLPPIDHVATIASPLQGADLAAVVVQGMDDPVGRRILEEVGDRMHLAPDSQAIRDLAVGSELVTRLDSRWSDAHRDPYGGPLATGTKVFTFGGTGDWVVPDHRSDLPGADHVLLPGAHSEVRDTEASRIALRAFLANQPVPGEAGGAQHWGSYGRSFLQQVAGSLVGPVPLGDGG
ncbi:MAG: peptidoglycan DD-metalloendopeptidase family protein [Nitriliruptorales bacterium]|nr:peptidoglycan DD-metalloendopeptidase family protein [Nitriliruptorales bacterium]